MFGCGSCFVAECWMCLVWVEVLCWIDRIWSSKECVCCACDPSVHLSVPSICYVIVCRKVISSFKSLRTGSQVFALIMLFLWVILHTTWSGKSMQLLCILLFGMLSCLPSVSCLYKLCWQCVCWWVWWSERKRTLCLL